MNTIECIPRDTLKQYLAGWIDEPQAGEIEQHLENCESCEHTVIELETEPDTLFEPIQRPAAVLMTEELESDVRRVVAKAEQLVPPLTSSQIDARYLGKQLGPYEILRCLGRGGMGSVYLAKHKKLHKQVAIKLLPAYWAESEEAAARFGREILATGKLNHPSIVSATDAGEEGGVHYLVMEYVDGVNLSELLRSGVVLSIADACSIMHQVALGLSHAHAGGIVHRDVKPSNVMLNRRGEVKVMDFGLAQLNPWEDMAAELTSVGQMMGTLDYMAPEQAERPCAVDYRADLYALGATLFRLLTGRAPLAAAPNLSPIEKLRMMSHHNAPRLDTLRSDAPPELVKLVGSLLDRRPENRPASAAHVAEQLEPLCSGSDLVSLAANACKAVESNKPGMRLPKQSALLNSHMAEVQPAAASFDYRRWTGWVTLIALLPFLALAGVLIVLETRKGQLVIESEVAGVHVKLLSEGKVVDDLQIDTGTTTTRLAADKYEIVLDSPSNSIALDKNEFTLKNGETVIARVTQRAPATAGTTGTATADPMVKVTPADMSNEPHYDAKPLSYWLSQIARERSIKGTEEALQAIDALVQPDNADRVTKTLLEALPTMPTMYFARESKGPSLSVFHIFSKANPGTRYWNLLIRQLETASPPLAKDWLSSGLTPRIDSPDSEWELFYQWLENNSFADETVRGANRTLVESSAWAIYRLLNIDTDARDKEKLETRFLPRMEKSKQLGLEFWLGHPSRQIIPRAQEEPVWSTGYRRIVTQQATKALEDSNTPPKLVCQAAMIVTDLLGDTTFDAAVIKDLFPSDVLAALAKSVDSRLTDIAGDRERFWRLNEVDSSFERHSTPRAYTSTRSLSKASEVIELMDLAEALKKRNHGDFGSALNRVVDTTRVAYLGARRALPASPSSAAGTSSFSGRPVRTVVHIQWPSLDGYQVMGGAPPRGYPQELTPQELLGYLICIQACEFGGIPLPKLEEEKPADPKKSEPADPLGEAKPEATKR